MTREELLKGLREIVEKAILQKMEGAEILGIIGFIYIGAIDSASKDKKKKIELLKAFYDFSLEKLLNDE
jgi:hypothetical protein